MSLWDGAKESAAKAGEAAMIAGQKTVLQGEIMLLDREINNRKRAFGVELYDHVQILSTRPEFYSSDDLLTATLRPPLLKAQREIAALEIKRGKFREEISKAEVARKNAFPTPAETWYEKMMNAGKLARMAGNEAKLSAELSMVEVQMRDYKETFGLELYSALTDLEDNRGWLPTDREIRSLYDNARRDIEKAEEKRKKKEQEVVDLGNDRVKNPNGSYLVPDAAAVNGNAASTSDSSGMFMTTNPPAGVGGGYGGSGTSTQQAPPPGKGGGYGSSVPVPPAPAPATSLGGGYGTSAPSAQAYNLGGGGYGLSSVNQTAASFYGDDYETTPVATPVTAPVAAPVAAPAPAGNNSSFSFITPEPDPFAGLTTEGSFLGSTSGTQSSASSTTGGSTSTNSNAGANLSGIFAGITGPSSSTTTGQNRSANGGSNFGESISGALVQASLKNPKAAATALSAANSISSSFKF